MPPPATTTRAASLRVDTTAPVSVGAPSLITPGSTINNPFVVPAEAVASPWASLRVDTAAPVAATAPSLITPGSTTFGTTPTTYTFPIAHAPYPYVSSDVDSLAATLRLAQLQGMYGTPWDYSAPAEPPEPTPEPQVTVAEPPVEEPTKTEAPPRRRRRRRKSLPAPAPAVDPPPAPPHISAVQHRKRKQYMPEYPAPQDPFPTRRIFKRR